MNKVPFNCIH